MSVTLYKEQNYRKLINLCGILYTGIGEETKKAPKGAF